MRAYLLALGIVLLCLSFMFQGIAIAQLIKVQAFAVSTEPVKPAEVFAPIGSAYWLIIGSLIAGAPGLGVLLAGCRRTSESSA